MDDAHQDHRLLGTMAPTVWRDALVLHYEIPKWDGDLGRSNCYVPISAELGQRKVVACSMSTTDRSGARLVGRRDVSCSDAHPRNGVPEPLRRSISSL